MDNNMIQAKILELLKRCTDERDNMSSMKYTIFIQVSIAIGFVAYRSMNNIFAVIIPVIIASSILYVIVNKYRESENVLKPYLDVVNPDTPSKLSDYIKTNSDIIEFKNSTTRFIILSEILQCISLVSVVLIFFLVINVIMHFYGG